MAQVFLKRSTYRYVLQDKAVGGFSANFTTDLMNNSPRKCLEYKTPFEVFAKMTGKDYFLKGSVALMG
jgi:IS30 family transposase